MTNSITIYEQMDIELILQEASVYGLRVEVEEYAQRYISEGFAPVEAYQHAYYEWIK